MWRSRTFRGVGRPAKGRVIEVLGDPDGFGVDVEIMIRKHHLPHVFPAKVLAEAAASAEETYIPAPSALDGVVESEASGAMSGAHGLVGVPTVEGRRDFRGLPIVTIDGVRRRVTSTTR